MSKIPRRRRSTANLGNQLARYSVFGPPPLIKGEDAAAYDALLAQISGAVNPADGIEEMLVRDIVDYVWEALRLRRIKAEIVSSAVAHTIRESLARVLDQDLQYGAFGLPQPDDDAVAAAEELVDNWKGADPAAVKQVDELLASSGTSVAAKTAGSYIDKLEVIGQLHQMEAVLAMRRDSVLRELDRHREVFARNLRRAVDQSEEAEVKALPTRSRGERDAA